MHNPFARFFRARDKPNKQASPQDAVSAAPGFYYGTSLAGKSVTPTSAIQVSAVYACVRVIAETIASLLSMAVKPGNSSIFVGKKEFEIMKKPGRGTNGHIAILTNNVDRAIYHLGQRGVKFDMASKNVKDGKTIAIYFADEIAGFAFHLVQR